MNFHCIAGVLYLCGVIALNGASLDDKVKAFEDALKTSRLVKTDSPKGISPIGRALTVQDLEMVMQRGTREVNIEEVVARLMATHSSDKVQQTGEDLIQELESQRKARAEAFETKANAVLSEVPDALMQAKKATDLDGILKEMQTLQNPQGGSFGDDSAQVLANKINATFQFVTQWQDYLSATSSGNMQEAQNSLRAILNNRQIDAPIFFPRSEILARFEKASGRNPMDGDGTPGAGSTDVDVILGKVKTVDDLSHAFVQLAQIPNLGWDWADLSTLDEARDNALAGLPMTLDLKKALNGPFYGDDISRIVAMELIAILPYYFGTEVSDPPKANETVDAYLDRLSATANTNGNLALLQRTIATKVALTNSEGKIPSIGTQSFLAGLSQDAAGQYAPAVISYERALKEPDRFLPVKIVGERLAAIKAAHPDEFEKGLTTFLTPPSVNPSPFQYPGMPWMQPNRFGNPDGNQISVLPIPMTISIPSRVTAPPGTGPTANATPVAPVSTPATK